MEASRRPGAAHDTAGGRAKSGLGLGREVPDFKMTTYDPKTGGFGEFSLAKQKENGRWSILFFYPADFTFV